MRKRYLALAATVAITAACGGHHYVPAPQPRSNARVLPMASSTAAPSAVQVTQVRLPELAAGGITVGANGAVYVNGYKSFIRYSAGAFTSTAYPLPAGASGVGSIEGQNTITAGPGGTIWSVLYAGSCCPTAGAEVASLTTSSSSIAESSGGTPAGDAFDSVAPDGLNHIWVIHHTGTVCSNARYDITIFDSSFRVLSRVTLPTTARLNAMTRGPDGMMYVATALTCDAGASQIFRVNPSTHAVLNTVTLPSGSSVKELAPGPDGAVWFTNYPDAQNAIGRVTSTGAVTSYKLSAAHSRPTGITLGSDGALWFTEEIAPAQTIKVGRISTAGAITEYTLAYQGPYLMASEITAGPPGGPRISHTLYVVARGFPYLFRLTF